MKKIAIEIIKSVVKAIFETTVGWIVTFLIMAFISHHSESIQKFLEGTWS